ncbi:MAG: BrxA/BrxB family bacilliredoxin [Flavobacteriales bacterium]|nr:BrxA/BrxB family bacilliredoxin [Flavobacteriales bacterium]MCX7650717.1 BrxA/BrxB family bacilliredoxin [Flavobacteriales bacterium]MDW8432184.1 BrxA/BrxB family bacilliredoxin [Flavobacteriales bacterium]
MYPAEIVIPFKNQLTSQKFISLETADAVHDFFKNAEGTVLLVVNSVCGCAAGAARPGVLASLNHSKKPDHLVTVFAGVDKEATEAARRYLLPYPPSSPAIALLRNGELLHMIERHMIEGRTAEMLAEHLKAVYDQYC